jgi:serine protease
MKKALQISIFVLALSAIFQTLQSQNTTSRIKPGQAVAQQPVDSQISSSQYVKGEITIKLREGVGEFGKQSGMVRFGIQSLDEKASDFEVYQLEKRFRYNPAKLRAALPDLSRIYKISFPDKFSLSDVVGSFSSDPNVEYAEPIPVYHTTEIPNDSLYNQLQHLTQIFAPEAWEIHKGEDGTDEIIIAIVDTGVDWEHEDLQSNVWQNLSEDADGDGHTMEFDGIQWILDPGDLNGVDDDLNGFTDDLLGWNFITGTGDPNPIPGNPVGYHGSHCAGIADGVTDNGKGIASISWNLSLMAICTDENNSVPYGWDGIIYAAENGADIISNSWGGFPYSIADQEVITYASGLGSIIVAAAGNNDNSPLFYPADYLNVISVASVSVDDSKAWYSCFNLAVDVSAPGGGSEGGILSTIPGNAYTLASGTSMASPLIAGCFGLLKSYHPDWSNEQLIAQLIGTADNIDTINPDYVNMLGTGRVNAYRMLSEENISPFLKLDLISADAQDANGNGINEPGEIVTLNLNLRNYAACYGADNVGVSITTEDPDIIIINGTGTVNVPPDGFFSTEDQIQIEIGVNASCHLADLAIHFESELQIIAGQDINFTVLVAPSGIFVYEGAQNVQDYSGTFIAGVLDQLGYDYTYSNTLHALLGFKAVFLSFGNYESGSTFFEDQMANYITNYLDSGGYVYLEGGDALGWDQAANAHLLELLGLASADDGYTNPINNLQGQPDALTYEMLFTGNSQVSNSYIDILEPSDDGTAAFIESGYGTVAVQQSIPDDRRTFCFSYSLAGLNDGEAPNTREELLNRILNFFDINTAVPEVMGSNAMSCNVYPNPMNTNAIIRYYLPEDSQVILEIFNSTGQKIMRPADGDQSQGEHFVQLNAEELPAGIYYYSLKSGMQAQSGKIIILK